MLEPPRHVKAMSNVGGGPSLSLNWKKIKVLFFSFIEEIKFNLPYNFYHWHHILNQSINVISNKNYISKLRTLNRMIV
jgi:hypothetical protein